MKIENEPGFIKFKFEECDWSYDWRGFIEEIKEKIPADKRSYDKTTNIWHISVDHKDTFYELKKKYFTDENQTELEI